MNLFDRLAAAAKARPKRIVLAEGEDRRVIAAAVRAEVDGLAQILLVGEENAVRTKLIEQGADPAGFEVHDPARSPLTASFARSYLERHAHKGVSPADASDVVGRPLAFAAMLVREGHADGSIGGATATTAETIRTALRIIGPARGVEIVSSFFLMLLDRPHHDPRGVFIFADCGLNVEPDAACLAQIALSSADSFTMLVGETPRVALLSFSTAGSASHRSVDKVVEAAGLVRDRRPDLQIDGDLQFDAAFLPDVRAIKAPDSCLEGTANVMVFPNLEAGNIGYKIAERIGGARAIGPILQGLARPANDLSRGCSSDDIHSMIAVTSIQAGVQARMPDDPGYGQGEA